MAKLERAPPLQLLGTPRRAPLASRSRAQPRPREPWRQRSLSDRCLTSGAGKAASAATTGSAAPERPQQVGASLRELPIEKKPAKGSKATRQPPAPKPQMPQQKPQLPPKPRLTPAPPVASQPVAPQAARQPRLAHTYASLARRRSQSLTLCLVCLIVSLCCVSPYVSVHSNRRLGLLLYESQLAHLNSCLFSVISSLVVLVLLAAYILWVLVAPQRPIQRLANESRSSNIKSHWLPYQTASTNARPLRRNPAAEMRVQRALCALICTCALASGLAYLAIPLMVPHIKQSLRMPVATFDCNANVISIENCYRQHAGPAKNSHLPLSSFLEPTESQSQHLLSKLGCLSYSDNSLANAGQVPARFLLHKCGLVCTPQRQQLHQFGDDLNNQQSPQLFDHQNDKKTQTSKPPVTGTEAGRGQLFAPYQRDVETELGAVERNLVYHNNSPTASQLDESGKDSPANRVSVRVCFSGEFNSGSSYKQFCITNLAGASNQPDSSSNRIRESRTLEENQSRLPDQTLTVGQLNSMLRRLVHSSGPEASSAAADFGQSQATNYVNPIVQFESHFNSWPQMSEGTSEEQASGQGRLKQTNYNEASAQAALCKFRPIPPFIVNNKPFSDIQCSLEREYTMSTSTPRTSGEKIYLKKAARAGVDTTESSTAAATAAAEERCNIQCKLNILYQVRRAHINEPANHTHHYYLPMRPCVVVAGPRGHMDKQATIGQLSLLRSIGDGSLLLLFVALDLLLLFECIATKRFQLESSHLRLACVLGAVACGPVIVAMLFEMAANGWLLNAQLAAAEQSNWLLTFVQDRALPWLADTALRVMSSLGLTTNKRRQGSSADIASAPGGSMSTDEPPTTHSAGTREPVDAYLAPAFVNCVLMFVIAVSSLRIPALPCSGPIVQSSSIEQLGLVTVKTSLAQQAPSVSNTKSSPALELKASQAPETMTSWAQRWAPVTLLALLLGYLFNLVHELKHEMLLELLAEQQSPGASGPGMGDSSSSSSRTSFAALSYALRGPTTGSLLVWLLLALVFINETSTLFESHLSPFSVSSHQHTQPIATVEPDLKKHFETKKKQRTAKLLTFMSISLIAYSARYYALATAAGSATNMPSSSSASSQAFTWLLVFLFYFAELFNFPISWYAITTRAHELVIQEQQQQQHQQQHQHQQQEQKHEQQERQQASSCSTSALGVHSVTQLGLAFVYFGLGRLVSTLAHTSYIASYLNDDNVDWFITNFYERAAVNSTTTSSNTSSNNTASHAPQSLFSPLPDERQTYLHASRLFAKHNSLLCLLIGIAIAAKLARIKYSLWSEKRRTLNIFQPNLVSELPTRLGVNRRTTPGARFEALTDGECTQSTEPDSDLHERLATDLMTVQATSVSRRQTPQASTIAASRPDEQPPRARLLYGFKTRTAAPSDTSSSSGSFEPAPRSRPNAPPMTATPNQMSHDSDNSEEQSDHNRRHQLVDKECQSEQEDNYISDDDHRDDDHNNNNNNNNNNLHGHKQSVQSSSGVTQVRTLTSHRSKRVRIVEERHHDDQPRVAPLARAPRITFAARPTTVVIQRDSSSATSLSTSSSAAAAAARARRASPEPSLCGSNDLDSIESI